MDGKKLSLRENLIMSLKYLVCAAGAGLIQFGSFALLSSALHFDRLFGFGGLEELKYGPSYFVALALSVAFNFTVNRKYTFKSANNVPVAMLKLFGYYCVFTPLSIWWGETLAQVGWNEYLVLIPTMLINFITEFLFCRFVVFGKSINTAKKA